MSSVMRVVFVRSGCAFILGCIGGLTGLLTWTAGTAQREYPRSPSAIVWGALGGTFGFVLAACIGNRRLRGRPAWLISGLVTGMLAGACIGWEWAHAEYGFARQQLLQDGLPASFIDQPESGFSASRFVSIGLQYGICLGIVGGATAGWFWKHPPRLSAVANLFPVACGCFVALGAIAMGSGFRELSRDAIEQGRQSWSESQRRSGATAVRDDSVFLSESREGRVALVEALRASLRVGAAVGRRRGDAPAGGEHLTVDAPRLAPALDRMQRLVPGFLGDGQPRREDPEHEEIEALRALGLMRQLRAVEPFDAGIVCSRGGDVAGRGQCTGFAP